MAPVAWEVQMLFDMDTPQEIVIVVVFFVYYLCF